MYGQVDQWRQSLFDNWKLQFRNSISFRFVSFRFVSFRLKGKEFENPSWLVLLLKISDLTVGWGTYFRWMIFVFRFSLLFNFIIIFYKFVLLSTKQYCGKVDCSNTDCSKRICWLFKCRLFRYRLFKHRLLKKK